MTTESYTRALNELCSTLSVREFAAFVAGKFYENHDVPKAFLQALEDMAFIEFDESRTRLKITKSLYNVTGEQVRNWTHSREKAQILEDFTAKLEEPVTEQKVKGSRVSAKRIRFHSPSEEKPETISPIAPTITLTAIQEAYAKALKALQETLSTTEYRAFDIVEFPNKYGVDSELTQYLWIHGYLLADDESQYPGFKLTERFYELDPITVAGWFPADPAKRMDDGKKARKKADELFEDVKAFAKGDLVSESVTRCVDRGEVWGRIRSFLEEPPYQPKPIATPYSIQIRATGLLLDMQVKTDEDVEIMYSVLLKLNRTETNGTTLQK